MALSHELVHHGYSQSSKWSTDISPSRIEATIFTKLCAAVQVEHTQQSKLSWVLTGHVVFVNMILVNYFYRPLIGIGAAIKVAKI
uniref:Uncharacterized protein n=1 Tax=Aegilops tauschii TaxID=37682 RepID=M8B0N3_AEGTA